MMKMTLALHTSEKGEGKQIKGGPFGQEPCKRRGHCCTMLYLGVGIDL